MEIKIQYPTEEELYLATWRMAQAESPWSQHAGPFVPNFEDELDDARSALRDPDSKCFMAIDEGKAIGVLACMKGDELARLGSGDREPAVLPDRRQTSAGVKLLDAAYEWSVGEGLVGVFALLKLPPEVDPREQWHVNLYYKWGMTLTRIVVECGASVNRTVEYANPQVEFKGADDLGLDGLCNLALRCFESTREFEYDPLVHDAAQVRASLSEALGAEGLNVAYLGDEAVGFVFARLPMGNREYGHVATMGILPEHRRKRIGMSLLQKAHNYISENGFDYSFVGTSEGNFASRALYRKMGYRSAYRILKFVKATKVVNIARNLIPYDLNDLRPLEEE